jgi:hypothetical protein
MLIRITCHEAGTKEFEMTLEMHGELPKAGSIIEIEDRVFTVSAVPTTWICTKNELIPVLHVLPKIDATQA